MRQFYDIPQEFNEQYKEFINKLTESEYLKYERDRLDLLKQLEQVYVKYNQIVADRESKEITNKNIKEFANKSDEHLQLIMDTLIFGYQHNLTFLEMYRITEQVVDVKKFKVNKEVLMDMPKSELDRKDKKEWLDTLMRM